MPMTPTPSTKYRPSPVVALPDRRWPDARITAAPRWLSTDLRDGNQALIEPMDIGRKLRLFEMLLAIGFKEIEVGFPASSQTEFDFVRRLIDDGRIPPDVTIQVMTPARPELIERTVEALAGAPRAIVHVYNAVAPLWRRVVFGLSVPEVMELIAQQVGGLRRLTDAQPQTEWVLQYSPETFSMAELEVSLQACDTAIQAWGPGRPVILNLPTTVESATPNVFADQVEWMSRRLARHPGAVLSVHPHNDRGTGVAAAELALMAGAQRVEGCLFGNGERTGNLDLVTLALNLYTQGVSPGLDFSDIDEVRRCVEHCNQLPVHPRHPYVGELVHTSFSGSHQDAIKKAFAQRRDGDVWEMPYLPIDPLDIGRSYEAVIRVNSQSGKGGISYLLESEHGLVLPRRAQIEFSQVVQQRMDEQGGEFSAADLWQLFERCYHLDEAPAIEHQIVAERADGRVQLQAVIGGGQDGLSVRGQGHGPLEAFVDGLSRALDTPVQVLDFHEHALGAGAQARAVAYLALRIGDARPLHGVGISSSIVTASLQAVISGLRRAGVALQPAEATSV